ncbi:MAG: ATP-binding cassette domain-containing protein [Calditrichaeota bacterium]|nr:MAG: ATP-binding cassette domain-containing protein [Calditrichota bacterium]MBL1204790.1 ATP-binding cassette domain-containing protein [Calditrichota bacterium]NOG44619.1 ATP-binding cassette domain-containing protein [Calditrichota bacterium]
MPLISLQNVSIHFGGPKILDELNLQIEKKQRVCLLGRNGTGKSTLMKLIAGQLSVDEGLVQNEQGAAISYLSQEIPQQLSGPVFNIVAMGLGKKGQLLSDYHKAELLISKNPQADHEPLNRLHEQLDTHHAWPAMDEIKIIISSMSLDADWQYENLSGGQKRRVNLAAALVSNPDLLLLDEPTNHLDISSIEWMEEFLKRRGTTLLFVTHDRMLLRRLATRIIELDRGKLVDWSCDYDTFLQRKEAVLNAEQKEWENFDKKLAQEEVWIRKGIRARRTRNEGRVRALKKMRDERKQRRESDGSVKMNLAEAGKSGALVIEAKDVSYNYDDVALIKNFSTIVGRGDKIGIIGPNGCGKTTLLKLLTGKLQLQSGSVNHGTKLEITYFDQLRQQLDDEKSAWENVIPNGDTVTIDGRSKHIISYLQDFLFTPERAKLPIRNLSGGERNRLLLARLFSKPANLLLLDEPTNDLDAETLELLEELIVSFKGTLILISHDRTLLNNVVTSTWVFEKGGRVKEYIGGYDDWLEQSGKARQVKTVKKTDKKKQYQQEKKSKRSEENKLSYKQKKDLEKLPSLIEELEKKQEAIHLKMSDPEFYKDKEKVVALNAELTEIENQLETLYEQWESLEALKE